jgi:hypothetical protein
MDKLYRSYGFTVSDESRANVALYGFYYWKEEMLMGVPEHAAVRIGGGWYESKLGADIQIIHRLGALEGPLYGFVGARFYEKKEKLYTKIAYSGVAKCFTLLVCQHRL